MPKIDELIIIRRTHHTDAHKLEQLITKDSIAAFGKINILELLERSVLCLTFLRDESTIIGCVCLSNAPDFKYAFPEVWQSWFQDEVNIPNVNSANSLFIRLLLLSRPCTTDLLQEICKTVYQLVHEVHHLFLIVNPGCDFGRLFLSTLNATELGPASTLPFEKVDLKKGNDKMEIVVAYRHTVCPVLYSRMAVVEDNDDLVPLFNSQTDLLRKTYGNYYIAELVEAQNDNLKCVVVECDRRAVGFVSATTSVDLDNLETNYDLTLFNGLRKSHPSDELKPRISTETSINSAVVLESAEDSYASIEEQASLSQDSVEQVIHKIDEGKLSNEYNWTRRPLILRQKHGLTPELVPTFLGAPDCFAIQLFAIKPEFRSRFIDMLPLLFDEFPGLNYVIISIPRLTFGFPMLRYFMRCRTRKGRDPEDDLYVFHRAGLHSDFNIRRTRHEDEPQVLELIKAFHPSDQSLILDDLRTYIAQGRDTHGVPINSYVAESLGKVVGIVILRDEWDIEWLRANYDIEDFIYFGHHGRTEHASVYHCVLAVNYHCHRSLFLREVMRQANKTCFYYRIFPPYCLKESHTKATLLTCLSNFNVVQPRKQIIYPPPDVLQEKAPEKRVLAKIDTPPALFIGTARLFLEPRVRINARIIVVGASTTGLAFLAALSSCHSFSLEYLGQFALRHCVHVVHGKLTEIERKFKYITIEHQERLSYDYLVLTPGLQYHLPYPQAKVTAAPLRTYDMPFRPTRRFSVECATAARPNNLFIINDVDDAMIVLDWVRQEYLATLSTKELNVPEWKKVKRNRQNSTADGHGDSPFVQLDEIDLEKVPNRLIVYGFTLDAYTCVAALLKAGVPGGHIIMIQPPLLEGAKPPFEDGEVSQTIERQLVKDDVEIARGYSLLNWGEDAPSLSTEITEVNVVGEDEKQCKVPCKALFFFHEKTVDHECFNAVNDACLVFDARLVIDINFHTNDPAIRAAGPMTKLQRVYYNDRWRHELANSYEIGNLLGQQMLNQFDPAENTSSTPPRDGLHLLPEFDEPKLVGGLLPGDYHYLYVSKPAMKELCREMCAETKAGRLLRTGSTSNGNGYFCLHINQYNMVQTIICLSKKPILVSNYIRLYRLHEMLLNKLVARFDEGLITDFYDFLNDVWPLAIYHDRFADFCGEVRDLMYTNPPNGNEPLSEIVREMISETGEIKSDELKKIKASYIQDGYKKAVEERLLSFINFNYNLLPMYAKPDLV